jgi:hypothetical protein
MSGPVLSDEARRIETFAREQTAALGHGLGEFAPDPHPASRSARCRKCGLVARYELAEPTLTLTDISRRCRTTKQAHVSTLSSR